MPMVNFNTKADFDAAYSVGVEPNGHPGNRQQVKVGYTRAGVYRFNRYNAGKLVELFNWPLDTAIVFVGAGFAWTAEVLETEYGYTNILGIDTSSWIQDNQDLSEEADLNESITAVGLDPSTGEGLAVKNNIFDGGNRRRASRPVKDEDGRNNGSRNRIRNALGGTIDLAITENVLSTLSDAEVLQLSDIMNQFATTAIHLDTEPQDNQDPAYNWHTIDEYKIMLPGDTIVSVNTWRVL